MADLSGVVAKGDLRESLEAVRDALAESLVLAQGDPRRLLHVAPLAKQLGDVLARLDQLPNADRASVSDDLRAKRAARRSAASG